MDPLSQFLNFVGTGSAAAVNGTQTILNIIDIFHFFH